MKIDYVFFGPYLSFLDSTPHALLRIKFLCPSVRTSLSSSCVQHACFVVICCLLWTVPRFLHISFSGCLRIVSPIHGTLPPKSFSFAVLRMSFLFCLCHLCMGPYLLIVCCLLQLFCFSICFVDRPIRSIFMCMLKY